jgi:hypothetical protein
MPNRLINEKSPYLLQHAHNPVEWYPWGDDAFSAARRANKPVFLSVGYATCHWCHVMERESFEDAAAAAALNAAFVCIKVDREERPDIDAVYMAACQMVTGSGGWPLTIVMTPDKKPFFAGTYLPKESAMGRLGLVDLCQKIAELWADEPQRVLESADVLAGHLGGAFQFESNPAAQPEISLVEQAVRDIARRFDEQFAGFDSAPKFPMAHRLNLLLRFAAGKNDSKVLEMTTRTLTAMRLGGLWDHVGFGFHRYATDRQWLVPHFEKMLYDQALLAVAYLEAFAVTRTPMFAQTAREIFAYVLRDMTDPQGGFYTAEDADSEGEEGKCYLWSLEEFERLQKEEPAAPPWTRIFNLTAEGNFLEEATRRNTGTNILHLTRTWDDWAEELAVAPPELAERWEQFRQALYAVRAARVPPLKDDKILTDWNGLMIAALATGAQVLAESRYLEAARKAALFILERLRDEKGRLLHRFRQGETVISATANDYAFLIMGLLALFRADNDPRWLKQATLLQAEMGRLFWDPVSGGFYLTAADQAPLPVRPKEIYDGAIPSANAVALSNLVHLGRLTGDDQWHPLSLRLVQAFGGSVRRQPSAYIHTLSGYMLAMGMGGQL